MTIYRERSNGRWEYWTYADGGRVILSEDEAIRLVKTENAKMVRA